MNKKIYDALTDAAISGDGVFFCYWDPSIRGAQEYSGDIATEVIDNVNIFPADVNRSDIQSQEYIILSGRQSVISLRAEARACGVSEDQIALITPSKTEALGAGVMSDHELMANGAEKGEDTTTYKCMMRTKRAIAFAEQLSEIEAYRPEARFCDAVKGLHLYGASVVYPAELVVLEYILPNA